MKKNAESIEYFVRMNMNKIAIIGNYPPRKCGIATFTKDLNDGF